MQPLGRCTEMVVYRLPTREAKYMYNPVMDVIRSFPGFQDVIVLKGVDDPLLVTELIVWESLERALQAAEMFFQHQEALDFMNQIDIVFFGHYEALPLAAWDTLQKNHEGSFGVIADMDNGDSSDAAATSEPILTQIINCVHRSADRTWKTPEKVQLVAWKSKQAEMESRSSSLVCDRFFMKSDP